MNDLLPPPIPATSHNGDVLSRSEEILMCRRQVKYWTDRLENLQAELRRMALLSSIEYDPEWVWGCTSDEEREDEEFAYEVLSTNRPYYDLFGLNPWGGDEDRSAEYKLPEKWMSDPGAVLAFLSNEQFQKSGIRSSFVPPESLLDHKGVVIASCAVNPHVLGMASVRLRDDEDVAHAAILNDGIHYKLLDSLQYASNRLLGDAKFILDVIARTGAHIDPHSPFEWFKFALLDRLDTSELNQIAGAVLDAISSKGADCLSVYCLRFFPPALRDDKGMMLQFVKANWYALEWCSNNLRSDSELVEAAASQSVNAYANALGDIHQAYEDQRTLTSVLEELANGLTYRNVPEILKSQPEVVLASLQAGEDGFIGSCLPSGLCHDRDFIFAFIQAHGVFDHFKKPIYRRLCPQLQRDEEIGLLLLKTGYYEFEEILNGIPSLWNSKEAMMGIAPVCDKGLGSVFSREFVARCEFLDDEEFMLAICATEEDNLRFASERLRLDRDFMLAVSAASATGVFIIYSPAEFQLNNPDIVAKAIEQCDDGNAIRLSVGLDEGVWRDRAVLMAWLESGKRLWGDGSILMHSPLRDDPEAVRLVAKNCKKHVQYASARLREDRVFALSLVRENGMLLEYLSETMDFDDEILTAAVANSGGVFQESFCIFFQELPSTDDIDNHDTYFLYEFAGRVRSKLEVHDSFVIEFLRGISICDQSHASPANRCQLPRLNRGTETSTAWKRLIAEYAGIPLGTEANELRAACANLTKFGF